MARVLRARKTGQVVNYKDRDAHPADGVSLWETCPLLAVVSDPSGFHQYWDDFVTYTAGDWTITRVDGGTDNADTRVIGDVAGGVLVITHNDAENDSTELQKKGEAYKLASTKELWFETRLKVGDADESDLYVGLGVTDSDSLGGATDGVTFRMADGSAAVSFVTEASSTETTTAAVHTAVDDTFVKLGFYYDGAGTVFGYVDGVLVATHAANIPSTELCVTFAHRNGAAAAGVLSVDYVRVVQVR